MVTRTTTKTQTAKAAAQATKPVVDTSVADDQQAFSFSFMGAFKDFMDAAKDVGAPLPSKQLLVASTITSIGAGVLSAYGTVQLGGYLAVGAMVLTGSAFLAWAILIITTLVAAYAALVTVSRTFAYMASGSLERDANRAKNWVTGFFGSKKVEASHA